MSDTWKKRKVRICTYIVSLCVLMLFATLYRPDADLTIRLLFKRESVKLNTHAAIQMGRGENAKVDVQLIGEDSRKRIEAVFRIGDSQLWKEGICFLFEGGKPIEESVHLQCIEISNQNMQVRRYSPEEIQELFYLNDIPETYLEQADIVFPVTGENPALIADAEVIEEIDTLLREYKPFSLNLYFAVFLVAVLLIIFEIYADSVRTCRDKLVICTKQVGNRISRLVLSAKKDIEENSSKYMIFIIVLAVFGVLAVALKGKLYGHPDEDVTKKAIDYYLGKWFPPDLRSEDAVGTFSDFGYSRLNEVTWYYLLAGKLGWIVSQLIPITTYYRMLNVLLFVIIACICVKHCKKEPWIYLAIGITPQFWYLFSYATSDGWDLFWSFIVMYELAYSESALHKFIEKRSEKPLATLLLCGIMFGCLLEAKKNFYIILLFAFLVLLQKLLEGGKENAKQRLIAYFELLGVAFVSVGIRYIPEFILYGNLDAKTKVINTLAKASKHVEFVVNKKVSLKKEGLSVFEVIKEKEPIQKTFQSSVGHYGWLEFAGPQPYVILMLVLSVIVVAMITFYLFRKNGWYRVEAMMLPAFVLLMYAIVVYWCWSGDFQPQGRYTMPIYLIAGYYASRAKEIFKNKFFVTVLLLLGALSLFSFAFIGARNLLTW